MSSECSIIKDSENQERARLYQGDCLEVMDQLPKVDMVLADPPYKMTKRGRSCRPNWMPDGMGDNVFESPLVRPDQWMPVVFRQMSEQSHLYVFTNTIDLLENLAAAEDAGFKLHNVISMIKDTGMPNRWYYKQTELVLFFRKGKARPINDYASRDNVRVEMPKAKSGKVHITQKPLDFIQKLVTNSSNDNQTVLDPFMGSGTTGVACMNTRRKFIGIELDPQYFVVARERIEGAA